MITRSPRPEPSGRGVLTSISANKAGAPFPKPTHSFIHSIPKASLIPDVFGPGSSLEIQKPSHPTNGKRPREIVATSSVIKRPRLDEHVKDHSSKQQVEEAKWRARWVKVFPTLVFHFEFDMDEAQRRTAMHRVSKMGAVSVPSEVGSGNLTGETESRSILLQSRHSCHCQIPTHTL